VRSNEDIKSEITSILAASAQQGDVAETDRQYLTTLVMQRTGLTEADSKARVDQSIERAKAFRDDLIEKTKNTAETARKTASQAAFWTAILSLLSGLAAMYAAKMGGRHRDENRF
jgi:galactose-1-phosphate uridylyltransferase